MNGVLFMRYKQKIILTALVIAAIAAAVGLFVVKKFNNDEYRLSASLYFFDDKKTSIIEEVRDISYTYRETISSKVLDELIKGSMDKKCVSPIGKGVKILNMENSEGDLRVDFSREFLSGDSSQDILATYAVIKSLCSVGDVRRVKVTVENKDIVAPDGNVIDYLASSDINISSNDDASGIVLLYFPSKTTQKLVSEVRKIGSSEDKKTLERYIVNEIIKGPADKNLQPVLTSDTTLISAETKDGICYVNFKSNFIDKNTGDKELLAIYSIVNSLTELESVRQVQFLIDGKKVNNFGQTYIGDIFSRNENVIENAPPQPTDHHEEY